MANDKGDHVPPPVHAFGFVSEHDESTNGVDHDPFFEPIVSLPEVPVSTMEEDEVEMLKLRAKLFRYDTHESPPEWKERGTGDIKLLRHTVKNCCRVVMRRDKTFKICANHYITPWMELKPNCGSDRAWVYSVPADYADEQIRPELLAVKFGNAENAQKWKDSFEEAKNIVNTQCHLYTRDGPDSEEEESDSDTAEAGEEDGQEETKEGAEETKGADKQTKEIAEKEEVKKEEAVKEIDSETEVLQELEKLIVDDTKSEEKKD